MWTVGIKLYCLLMSGFSKLSDRVPFTIHSCFLNLLGSHTAQYFSRKNLQQSVSFTKCMHEKWYREWWLEISLALSLAVGRRWSHFQSKHDARLWGCVPVHFFMPFTHKLPSVSFTRMYVIDYVAWVPTAGWTLAVGWTGTSWALDHLESSMELDYCLHFSPY